MNHLLVDPTYTLIEAWYSILSVFCTTHNHHSVSEATGGLLDKVTSHIVL